MANLEVHSSRRLVGAAEPSDLCREPSIRQRGITLNPPPPTRAHAQPPVSLFSAFHYRIHPLSPSIHCFHPSGLKSVSNPLEKYESVFAVLLTKSLPASLSFFLMLIQPFFVRLIRTLSRAPFCVFTSSHVNHVTVFV